MDGAYDLVIVGGGVAGLCAALAAPTGARICVVDKGEAGAGSSPLAQGGLAAAVGPEDSPELHAADTLAAGAGICDERVVADVCGEGPAAIDWLVSLGCAFDRASDGGLDLAREGGQSMARSVHWRDATGAEIVRALRGAVRERDVVRVAARAVSLVVFEGRCVGVMLAGEPRRIVRGRAVLLATGGGGALWGRTTNAPGATADGVALAPALAIDLEFMQFHPTALDAGDGQRVLITEALRGDGAILVDAKGERFVDELAPRHVVAKAILDHTPAFLDCRSIRDVAGRFPTVAAAVRARGFDIASEPLPVSPAAHYFIGGVAADAYGRTATDGLFAAGECSSTGMHGANRLAGNSLLEAVVVGRRVGPQVGRHEPPPDVIPWAIATFQEAPFDPAIAPILWRGAGPIRTEDSLRRAFAELNQLEESSHRSVALGIVHAALDRTESRGVHIRADYPAADRALARRIPSHTDIVGRVSRGGRAYGGS